MSSSDSDNSIDWLASDEDDYDSPKRLSPQQAEESPQPPSSSSSSSPSSSSSSSSVRESPTSRRWKRSGCCDCKDGGRCGGDADSAAAAQTSPVSPVQGFTSVCEQLPVESKRHSERKRLCEKTPADTEHELLSQK
ncbi:putative protein TPRXL, partial [Plectropomus leopardus]|uniref:putative protein TPRXL n=1 Tax=Plectropomus leopardus TaxID=160734 RepID=UPI001C4DC2D7